MSLRDAALAAFRADAEREAAEKAAAEQEQAARAVAWVKRTPLGEWFPDVEWTFIGELSTGGKLKLREALRADNA